jgi:hypothetical protein
MEGSLVAYKVFTNGSVLNASEINENLMQQSVATFSNAAARTAAITSPVEGQTTYLLDVDRYESYSGSAWVQVITPGQWINFTPVFTNITVGNGVITAKYTRVGRTVHFSIRFVWGSTTTASGIFIVSLPLAKASNSFANITVLMQDGTFGAFPGFADTPGDSMFILAISAAGTFATQSGTGATDPFTWSTNDVLSMSGTYETSVA